MVQNMETYHEGSYRCSRVGHADCCPDAPSERGPNVPGEFLIRVERLLTDDKPDQRPKVSGRAYRDGPASSVYGYRIDDGFSPTSSFTAALAAMEHPRVDCIGHLTGRMLGRREPYPVDVEAVAAAAARTGTMLEINGNPNRRDLSERHARLAAEAGVMICVNTDAHRIATLENVVYGIATARRAWLTPRHIANTRSWREFAKLRKRAR